MDALITILSTYGYWGMLAAAFLAGSFFPFSSEAVMLALLATGLDGWQLIVYGSIGSWRGAVPGWDSLPSCPSSAAPSPSSSD